VRNRWVFLPVLSARVTVPYTCTAVGPSCPTGTETYVRTYSITGDCATNAFTGTGTGPEQAGETISGQVTGNNLTYTVTSSGALTTFTGSFTGPNTYSGTATNTYFSGAPNDTFTATGVITSSDFSQCTNHDQYVKSGRRTCGSALTDREASTKQPVTPLPHLRHSSTERSWPPVAGISPYSGTGRLGGRVRSYGRHDDASSTVITRSSTAEKSGHGPGGAHPQTTYACLAMRPAPSRHAITRLREQRSMVSRNTDLVVYAVRPRGSRLETVTLSPLLGSRLNVIAGGASLAKLPGPLLSPLLAPEVSEETLIGLSLLHLLKEKLITVPSVEDAPRDADTHGCLPIPPQPGRHGLVVHTWEDRRQRDECGSARPQRDVSILYCLLPSLVPLQ
jgi:hypothetical protein